MVLGKLNTENYIKEQNKDVGFEYVIRYDDGITAEHVIASGSLPVNFEYLS